MEIQRLTHQIEVRARKVPHLNIDTFIIPSPYILHGNVRKNYDYSFTCITEGEILGYMLVYSDEAELNFHIYTIVMSPYGRGRGIGTAFLRNLARNVEPEASLYIYVWEKQKDTIEFFENRGFSDQGPLVYQKLVFRHLATNGKTLSENIVIDRELATATVEEIGNTRHDARKILRLLLSMIDTLSLENCDRIIEDVNREVAALTNALNSFRDSVERIHEINLRELLFKRIVPYVEGSSIPCQIRITLDSVAPIILGNYDSVGRALINLTSNALDSIAEASRPGMISIGIRRKPGVIYLTFSDNGIGIPPELQSRNAQGVPEFVGKTTKAHKSGEGLGTKQIFSTFGSENIYIHSNSFGTSWRIRCFVPAEGGTKWHQKMERRYNKIATLLEDPAVVPGSSPEQIVEFIWQLRRFELFLFDVILHFGSNYNVRQLYRVVLSYLHGQLDDTTLEQSVKGYESDSPSYNLWMLDVVRRIKRGVVLLGELPNIDAYSGAMLESYGQGAGNLIIFTMNPATGRFLATDRKLAEHLDFVPYLDADRDQLLRGEFVGSMSNSQPIFFGVWSIESREDLMNKLVLIQQGATQLLRFGIPEEKRLSFYQTTYPRCDVDIDVDRVVTVGEFAGLSTGDLDKFIREAEQDLDNFIVYRD